MDKDVQKRFRKNQDSLLISGIGVIAFGAWGIVRMALQLFMNYESYESLVYQAIALADPDLEQGLTSYVMIAVLVLISIFLLIEFGMRLYIGRAARAEARGKRKGVLYIILAIILAVAYIWGLADQLIRYQLYGIGMISMIVSFMVDITSLLALLDVIISAIIVKQLKKKYEIEG